MGNPQQPEILNPQMPKKPIPAEADGAKKDMGAPKSKPKLEDGGKEAAKDGSCSDKSGSCS